MSPILGASLAADVHICPKSLFNSAVKSPYLTVIQSITIYPLVRYEDLTIQKQSPCIPDAAGGLFRLGIIEAEISAAANPHQDQQLVRDVRKVHSAD